ncbi:C40 family peptidase [Streptomyces sp. S1D4-11]
MGRRRALRGRLRLLRTDPGRLPHRLSISIPRVAQAQYDAGPRLPGGAQLAPGDLLFFGTGPSAVTHVSLYSGGGRAIDAPHPGAVVREGPARTNSPSFRGATRPAVGEGGAR